MKHDYCLVDCPPSLGRSIATALAGADGIIPKPAEPRGNPRADPRRPV
ncbi:hypothetical protein [Salinibacter ruber]|nr:hypothetical protein [Salinibacter ruber]